jgi:hypothetical protein
MGKLGPISTRRKCNSFLDLLTPAIHSDILRYMINPPKYSKPAYVKVPTKTQMRKELAALKRDIKKGLNGPDADLYRMMEKAARMMKV